jgi:FMN phosphatase YigB (HAD superfamily)
MPSNIKVLITDLDNTLYDWVSYFSSSFYAMVDDLTQFLNVDKETILSEFKKVHENYANTEQPFAILEIETLKRKYPNLNRKELFDIVDPFLHSFNKKRNETLKLYEGVQKTLEELVENGVKIIGHTESTIPNALFRLNKLGIKKYFKHLYALEGKQSNHPDPNKQFPEIENEFVITVPSIDRKPNPKLIGDICLIENVKKTEVAYIGDSLTRDISMAKEAGVVAIWAKYGKDYDEAAWQKLVKITHWTEEDVSREASLRNRYSNIQPDYIINSFREVSDIIL